VGRANPIPKKNDFPVNKLVPGGHNYMTASESKGLAGEIS
jgi:hypothetical protein